MYGWRLDGLMSPLSTCKMFVRPLFLIAVLVGHSMSQTEKRDAHLRLYHGSMDHFTEAALENSKDILSGPGYNNSRGSVFFAHGFTGRPDGPAVTAVVSAYLERNEYNVFLLDWEYLASESRPGIPNSYLNWAAPNARMLGTKFADTLLDMASVGLVLENVHLVGHSLGAQIFGIAGSNLAFKNVILPWITGLDPASVGFENRPLKLHAGSARFVDIIHTDPSKYGYKRSHGTVDFWPNYHNRGPVDQPGCERELTSAFSSKDLCNHNRCWQLLVESIKQPGSLVGSYGKNYRSWKNTLPSDRRQFTTAIGSYYLNVTPGNYFFTTNAESPFGLGDEGI